MSEVILILSYDTIWQIYQWGLSISEVFLVDIPASERCILVASFVTTTSRRSIAMTAYWIFYSTYVLAVLTGDCYGPITATWSVTDTGISLICGRNSGEHFIVSSSGCCVVVRWPVNSGTGSATNILWFIRVIFIQISIVCVRKRIEEVVVKPEIWSV